jgi:hypothetical protein
MRVTLPTEIETKPSFKSAAKTCPQRTSKRAERRNFIGPCKMMFILMQRMFRDHNEDILLLMVIVGIVVRKRSE